jgi:hypothetical protein
LHDRLGNALELADPASRLGTDDPRARTIADLFVAQATVGIAALRASAVVPIAVPPLRALHVLSALLLAVGFAIPAGALCEGPPATGASGPDPAGAAARAPAPAIDLALAEPLREDLRRLEDGKDAPARIAAAMLEVLEALEKGELDRAEAFTRLEQLEQELLQAEQALEESLEEDPWLLGDAVRELAERFEDHELTREVAAALEEDDPDAAERALRDAQEQAEREAGDTREALDAALEDAEKSLGESAGRNTDTAAALAEEERRLKRQQQRPAEDPEEQERRLQRQQDKVDELRRQHEREKAAQRELDRLRREARDARDEGRPGQEQRPGQKQRGQQGQQGQESAGQRFREGLQGAARKAQVARRMGGARDALEEAKSFVRRTGQQGEGEQRRKGQQEQFAERAKGKGDGKGKGEQGKGQEGKSTLLVEGEVGQGEPDMFMESDQPGEPGTQGPPADAQSGEPAAGGQEPGDGSVEALGDPSGLDARAKNVRVAARHGEGATRAEVIATASQDGFANERYREVYQDYRAFAQSAIDIETLPAAQRRRVKRYFQMIQPRD